MQGAREDDCAERRGAERELLEDEDVLEDSEYADMMQTLGELDLEHEDELDEEEDSEGDTKPVLDPELEEMRRDPGQFLEDADELLNSEGVDEEKEQLMYNLDEEESRRFLEKIGEIDPDEFFENNRDVIQEVEQAIIAERLKDIPHDSARSAEEQEKESKWDHPYDKLCWDLAELLFPRRGKRDHRQNWDHINVSEEVKQKREAKKAKGYSIWLSMEIQKVLQHAMSQLRKLPVNSQGRQGAIRAALRTYSTILKHQERKFNLRNVTGMLHAIAKLVDQSPNPQELLRNDWSVVVRCLVFVEERLSLLDGRGVCELVWTFQKLGPDVLTLSQTQTAASESLQTSSDQTSLLHSILDHGKGPDISYNAKDTALLIHTLLQLNLVEDQRELMETLLRKAVEEISNFRPRDLSMLLWCLPQLEMDLPQDLVSLLISEAIEQASEFTPQSLANSLYGLARLSGRDYTALCSRFSTEIENKLGRFKPQELANVMWGFSKLRYLPSPKLLNRIAAVSVGKMESFSLQSASSLILACATFQYRHASLAGAIRARIVFHEGEIQTQDLTNVAWAFAVLDFLDPQFMQFCLQKLQELQRELPLSEKLQIYQCFIHFSIYFPKSNVFRILPPEVLEDCRLHWIRAQSCHPGERVLDNILAFLQREGYECQGTYEIEGGVFQVATVSKNGVRYVLECIPQDVRFCNQPNSLIGKLTWRENVLTRFGYFLLRIDPGKWMCLETDEQRREFFRRVI